MLFRLRVIKLNCAVKLSGRMAAMSADGSVEIPAEMLRELGWRPGIRIRLENREKR